MNKLFLPPEKSLVLGTSLWGWSIDKKSAFDVIDSFVSKGGSHIDTAANYPINKNYADFKLAVRWLEEWIKINGDSTLRILIKVGSLNNSGNPDFDLSKATILNSVDEYVGRFKNSLSSVAVHWDNRDGSEKEQVNETVSAFKQVFDQGLSIGFSGVKNPHLYLEANPDLSDKWCIQVKENISTQAARSQYNLHFPKAQYLAYGINMGGVKREEPVEASSVSIRGVQRPEELVKKMNDYIDSDHGFFPAPCTFNEIALACSFYNPALNGIIIGPRTFEQLDSTLDYWSKLKQNENEQMASRLLKV